MKKSDLFITIDLYENKDIATVFSHLTVVRRMHVNGELHAGSKKEGLSPATSSPSGSSSAVSPHKDLERQRELERERQKKLEIERQQEMERKRALEGEKERERIAAHQDRVKEQDRQREAERQVKEKDRLQLLEVERELEDQRLRQVEAQKQRDPGRENTRAPPSLVIPSPPDSSSPLRRGSATPSPRGEPPLVSPRSYESSQDGGNSAEALMRFPSSGRASVTSLTDDIAAKEMIKYDPNLERKAKKWIEVWPASPFFVPPSPDIILSDPPSQTANFQGGDSRERQHWAVPQVRGYSVQAYEHY